GDLVPEHPGGEVLHPADVQAGEHLLEDGVVVQVRATDRGMAEVVAVQLTGEGIGQSFGDDMLADHHAGGIPHHAAGGVAQVVVQLVRRGGLETNEVLLGGPHRQLDVPGHAAVAGGTAGGPHEGLVPRVPQHEQHGDVGDTQVRKRLRLYV